MRLVTRYTSLLFLGLLAGSEALVLQWALLALGLQTLSPASLGLAWLALMAGNFALIAVLRGGRELPGARAAFGAVMLGSLGALFTGPPLLAVFALVGLPLLALDGLPGPGMGSGVLVAGGGLAVALGFGSILWGFLVGQRRVEVERIDIPMRNLPPELEGLRMAQITDLHIGPQLRAPKLARFVERINELDADLIVITGDIFDFDPAFIEEGCRELGKLHARHGVFAITGNHDVYTGVDAVAAGLAQYTQIRLLRDECLPLQIRGGELYLIGIDDPGIGWNQRHCEHPELERLAREVPDDAAQVLLMHRPSYFAQVARLGFPLALAGHTHGGQISLPPPAHQANVSRLLSDWTRGLFAIDDSLLYVSRGLGIAGPPVRLNCSREIALHHLRGA